MSGHSRPGHLPLWSEYWAWWGASGWCWGQKTNRREGGSMPTERCPHSHPNPSHKGSPSLVPSWGPVHIKQWKRRMGSSHSHEAGPAPGWALGGEGEFRREKMLVPSSCSNTSAQFIKPRMENSKEQNPCVVCAEFLSMYGFYSLFGNPRQWTFISQGKIPVQIHFCWKNN